MAKRTEQHEIACYTPCQYQISVYIACLSPKKMLLVTKYDYQVYSTELEIIENKNNSCVRVDARR
ncbi:hypothetical protein ECANGB1_641 [Enterospora canceri]|uniref:Uncharacterized protein n=1 Tax=Enterospora canceri TaxID=1081671 RepID=A0A1Y1S7S1_9MICR|nr:hypothetical protein ECANGB1_641 [Enterospora canceri]